jgi:hypothetical protein
MLGMRTALEKGRVIPHEKELVNGMDDPISNFA